MERQHFTSTLQKPQEPTMIGRHLNYKHHILSKREYTYFARCFRYEDISKSAETFRAQRWRWNTYMAASAIVGRTGTCTNEESRCSKSFAIKQVNDSKLWWAYERAYTLNGEPQSNNQRTTESEISNHGITKGYRLLVKFVFKFYAVIKMSISKWTWHKTCDMLTQFVGLTILCSPSSALFFYLLSFWIHILTTRSYSEISINKPG